ncbi:STN domain-containing protein [Pseudomonas sp. R5(2019)]|uniref:STN domain-containing protein n=1 Tax=Pseudomonas sp. R5(2019) TaxID=2697566 RepID=UPI0014134976|nr:STN domain-containing protein [Pseudomonas sp. R5(2019)]NBA98412.1 hypothetical protein [Pseudomonas sp. R5(2019)]
MTRHTPSLFRISALAVALSCALTALSTHTGLAIGVDAALLRGRSAPALRGDYSTEQALDTLLQGSGLQWRRTGNSIVVEPAPPALELGNNPLALSDTLVWPPAVRPASPRSPAPCR